MKTEKKSDTTVSLWTRIYQTLTKKQKRNFVIILIIMLVSAALSQLLPVALGDLTNNVLSDENVSFVSVVPFLAFILAVTIVNEILKSYKKTITRQ